MLFVSRMRSARRCAIFLLALLGAVCFARVVRFGFAYDDHWTVVGNAALERPLAALLRAVLAGSEQTRNIPDSTRPAMIVSAWLDRRIFGLEAAGHHLHSLALYALVCALAGLVLLRLGRSLRVAFVGGALFAVAPVHAEVVAAINYREDLIAAAGVLIPLAWLYGSRGRRDRPGQELFVASAWLIGLLGKESAVALVPILAGLWAVQRPDRSWFRDRSTTLLALGCVLVLWASWRIGLRVAGVDDVPLADRGGLALRVLSTARYEVRALAGALVPFAWSPEYAREAPASAWWLVGLGGVVVAVVLLASRRATRLPALGLVFALLAPLPTSPLVGPANERADRFVFLAVLGAGLVWGWLGHVLARYASLRLRTGALLLIAALVPCAVVAQRAAAPWANDFVLWSTAIEKAPGSFRAWVGLSRALRLEGRLDEADRAIQRALALEPKSFSAHVTRAYNRLARGDVAGARQDIRRVHELGGRRQRGLRRAERCAALEPEAARTCILAPPPGSPGERRPAL